MFFQCLNVQNTDSPFRLSRINNRQTLVRSTKGIDFPPDPNQRSGSLPDRRLIRSLSAFSLAKEDQVNENA
ncbi:MAG: hypothetical protein DME80_02835 [Verrucomicrobia bacterium]|nr:MAG: hypothetical protein DME89_12500 [Verrucomicrobiota bacterium]PYJ45403.1 MAG: hypothetical protein DME80_02835 [Verrucomicrobiota bacterium]